ncbi:MAG TPA: DUF4142 domain-containing protein [Stellaceae bacterium]|nr:DUF4142 domain-containing protein [Stellaceae bacterium]
MSRRRFPAFARAVLLPIFCAVALAPSWRASATEPAVAEQDRQFLYWASESEKADAAMNQLALDKSQDPLIKQFARNARDEDRQRDSKLVALSQAHHLSLPHALDAESRSLHDNIAAITGDSFDHLFMRNAVDESRKTITLYEQEAGSGKSSDIEAFVAEELPRLQRCYEEAREAEMKLPGTEPLMSPSGVVQTHKPSPPPMPR